MKNEKTLLENFVTICLMLIFVIPFIALNGYLLMKYWGWFVTPIFGILLNYKSAVGLSYFILYLRYDSVKNTDEDIFDKILKALIGHAIVFIVAYLIHLAIN